MATKRNQTKSNKHWVEYLPFYFLFSENVFEEELKKRQNINGFKIDANNIKNDFKRSIGNLDTQLKQIEHG